MLKHVKCLYFDKSLECHHLTEQVEEQLKSWMEGKGRGGWIWKTQGSFKMVKKKTVLGESNKVVLWTILPINLFAVTIFLVPHFVSFLATKNKCNPLSVLRFLSFCTKWHYFVLHMKKTPNMSPWCKTKHSTNNCLYENI